MIQSLLKRALSVKSTDETEMFSNSSNKTPTNVPFMQYPPSGHTPNIYFLLHLSPADICIPINTEDILSTYCKCTLSAITHKLNVSGHILMSFFLVFACGTCAQILFPSLSYICIKSFVWALSFRRAFSGYHSNKLSKVNTHGVNVSYILGH
jgi:hypothetical protein